MHNIIKSEGIIDPALTKTKKAIEKMRNNLLAIELEQIKIIKLCDLKLKDFYFIKAWQRVMLKLLAR